MPATYCTLLRLSGSKGSFFKSSRKAGKRKTSHWQRNGDVNFSLSASTSPSEETQEKGRDNGIVNPSGALIAGFAPLYLALVPVTSWLSKPDGLISKAIHALVEGLTLIPGTSAVAPESVRIIPALSAVYIFWTFGFSGALSAAGQAMSRPQGLDDRNPREFVAQMRGLPQRLRSAHYNLMENFPAFAVAAALAQALSPPQDPVVVNLLGLHVLAKVCVYYPAYLADFPPPRTLAHITATAAVINVCWRLAMGS